MDLGHSDIWTYPCINGPVSPSTTHSRDGRGIPKGDENPARTAIRLHKLKREGLGMNVDVNGNDPYAHVLPLEMPIPVGDQLPLEMPIPVGDMGPQLSPQCKRHLNHGV